MMNYDNIQWDLYKVRVLFTITFITFLMMACLMNGFSQEEAEPERMVRVVYFLPKNSQAQPNINAKLDTWIKNVQKLYADGIKFHGFGKKTFRLETDTNGKAVIHHFHGQSGEKHYHQGTFSKVIKEISKRFDGSKNTYLIAVETSTFEGGRSCGRARNVGKTGGYAMIPATGYCVAEDVAVGLAAHELGHVFGLKHDFRKKAYIMSYGWDLRQKISRCAAEWLSVHPYFNPLRTDVDQPTTIKIFFPIQEVPPDKLRFRFKVSDADGLVQAQLHTLTTANPIAAGSQELIAYQSLAGERSKLTFVTNEMNVRPVEVVSLQVLDKKGNVASLPVPIQRSSSPGPKIRGPWLWVIAPTGNRGGADAAKADIDYLKQESKGKVTEKQIATEGVTAGETVGNKAWTPGRLASTGEDNIQKMLTRIGLCSGDVNNHVAYGSITLTSPRKQQTTMFAGSDDAVKVWLNGQLVHNNPVNRLSINYQDYFPVTLKQGRNVLLVAVYEKKGDWSGFFGFRSDKE